MVLMRLSADCAKTEKTQYARSASLTRRALTQPMSISGTLSTGYRAVLVNGKWEIVPPKKETPIDPMLNDIQRALKANFYFLALATALALPDICACLESAKGHNINRSAEAYKKWFDANLSHEFNELTADDCYRLRCGILHQGNFNNPNSRYDHVVFVPPNRSLRYGKDIVVTIAPGVAFGSLQGRILHIEVVWFCELLIRAVCRWLAAKATDATVQANLPNLVRLRPEGFPPYIVGIPLIA